MCFVHVGRGPITVGAAGQIKPAALPQIVSGGLFPAKKHTTVYVGKVNYIVLKGFVIASPIMMYALSAEKPRLHTDCTIARFHPPMVCAVSFAYTYCFCSCISTVCCLDQQTSSTDLHGMFSPCGPDSCRGDRRADHRPVATLWTDKVLEACD